MKLQSRNSPQFTIKKQVSISGIGLHSGIDCSVTICPANCNNGITFGPFNSELRVRAIAANVLGVQLATTIGTKAWKVRTVEHLLATLYSLGVDNAHIYVAGPEIPILDGSAKTWVSLLGDSPLPQEEQGTEWIATSTTTLALPKGGTATVSPIQDSADQTVTTIRTVIDFPNQLVGRQKISIELNPTTFKNELSWARTFGFESDVAALHRMGLAKGGSLENAVIYGEGEVLNPNGLLKPDEAVRHKTLDVIGDLALLGAPIKAQIEVYKPGHGLTVDLVNKLLSLDTAQNQRHLQ